MKGLIYGSALVFGSIGSYIPAIWHASLFSMSSIIFGILGTLFGIWFALRFRDYFGA